MCCAVLCCVLCYISYPGSPVLSMQCPCTSGMHTQTHSLSLDSLLCHATYKKTWGVQRVSRTLIIPHQAHPTPFPFPRCVTRGRVCVCWIFIAMTTGKGSGALLQHQHNGLSCREPPYQTLKVMWRRRGFSYRKSVLLPGLPFLPPKHWPHHRCFVIVCSQPFAPDSFAVTCCKLYNKAIQHLPWGICKVL